MRRLLYPHLAWEGIRKNRRLYLPYLLTCICMVMMHYILGYLASPECTQLLPRGGDSMAMIMTLGGFVMVLFSVIFLYYTQSFLIRRRTHEFGLYNVLGMGKRNLTRIISWESGISTVIALCGGLLLGVLLSKMAELCLVRMLGGTPTYRLMLVPRALGRTVGFYVLIFTLIWLSSVIRVGRSSAVHMLRSESAGEKPPKANWVLGILGLALLGAAYGMAVRISNPLDALIWFFAAVLMVIVGTYLLMIAGSVLLCRILQKKKGYYYRPNHFVSVSSMAYRMKRNGAGLASICIISTMVLVMISSSSCLWYGADDAIVTRYPRQINVSVYMDTPEQWGQDNVQMLRGEVRDFARREGFRMDNVQDIRFINLTGAAEGGQIQCDHDAVDGSGSYGALRDILLISAEDYCAMTGEAPALDDGEAAILTNHCSFPDDRLTLRMGEAENSFRVVSVKESRLFESTFGSPIPSLTVIVPDAGDAIRGFSRRDREGRSIMTMEWNCNFDTDVSEERQKQLRQALDDCLSDIPDTQTSGFSHCFVEARVNGYADFYASNGGLFFMGILLSIVFALAAVLIIYYKQISEGYEDQKRFDIMQKVGMTRRGIRRSINSQLLTVFFLPLTLAAMHLCFAFPMIRKLLMLFSLFNVKLFITTTLISFAVFALFYCLVYRGTSRAYYAIVSGTADNP